MKVLVIGGTLFIGRLLVEELVKGGHEVAVLHRKPKHEFGRQSSSKPFSNWDGTSAAISKSKIVRSVVISTAFAVTPPNWPHLRPM